MSRKFCLAAISCALALGTTAAARAAEPELTLLDRPAHRFERTIETHKLTNRYRELVADAKRFDAAPADDLLEERDATAPELRDGVKSLRTRIAAAKRRAKREATPDFGVVAGVSQATLDAIGACESGGDPTAVDSSGTYYGKYQFDTGTWASVGGSGSPAEASEAEQDYRASLLYARAGSSPWPVCGQ